MIHRFGDYEIDTDQRKFWVSGELQALEPQVFRLLAVLIKNRNRIVTRDELIDAVWQGRIVSDSTLASRIKSARQAIGDSGERQDFIQTVYGCGYRFVGPLMAEAEAPSEPSTSTEATTLISPPVTTRLVTAFNRVQSSAALRFAALRWRWLSIMLLLVGIGVGFGLWHFLPLTISPKSMARTSIAVLPFLDMSAAGDQEYFADGVAEEILNALTKVKGLRVVGRTSSFSFKGQNADVKIIGERLNVETVLEGSIRRSQDRVRITTQLIDTSSGYHLWSETYDREMQDILAIQDDIAHEVVQRLNLILQDADSEKPLVARDTRDPEAYRLYLQGRHLWKRRRSDSLRRALKFFQEAIARDAGFARAHSALAATYLMLPGYTLRVNRAASYEAAERTARTALKLAPELSEPHAVLGLLYSRRLEWRRAERWFQRALALEPVDPVTHLWYGAHSKQVGRLQQALTQFEKALAIDPAWSVVIYAHSQMLYALGQPEAALKEAHQTASLGYIYSHLLLRDMAYGRGDFDQAVHHQVEYLRMQGYSEDRIRKKRESYAASLGLAGSLSAFVQETEELLQAGQLSPLAAFDRFYHAKQIDQAIELFDPKAEPGFIRWIYKIWWPYGRPFRTHPQFASFAADLNLISYWREFGWPEHCGPDPTHGVQCH